MDCLFCRIAGKEIPADIVYEDGDVLAFRDINPQAPLHLLVIPRRHISTMNDLDEGDSALVGKLIVTAKNLAKEGRVDEEGYRIVVNCNGGAGQTVFHIHAHLLGGRDFSWPPG